ncbi:MAG: plasmid partition protein ParG [Candidatus Woesearchaeota archaeon]
MGRVNIEINDELHKRMKVSCALKEKTIIDFVNKAIKEKLDKEKAK